MAVTDPEETNLDAVDAILWRIPLDMDEEEEEEVKDPRVREGSEEEEEEGFRCFQQNMFVMSCDVLMLIGVFK